MLYIKNMQYLLILLKTFIYYTICLLIIKLSGFNMRLLFVKQTNDGWPTKVVFEDIIFVMVLKTLLIAILKRD